MLIPGEGPSRSHNLQQEEMETHLQTFKSKKSAANSTEKRSTSAKRRRTDSAMSEAVQEIRDLKESRSKAKRVERVSLKHPEKQRVVPEK